jgi:hypothetical protein
MLRRVVLIAVVEEYEEMELKMPLLDVCWIKVLSIITGTLLYDLRIVCK